MNLTKCPKDLREEKILNKLSARDREEFIETVFRSMVQSVFFKKDKVIM